MIVKLSELSAYWKHRADFLDRPFPDGTHPNKLAEVVAIELRDCANQIDKVIAGETTEADGFVQ